MTCNSPSTCDCICTQVVVDAGVGDVSVACDVFEGHFTGCRCNLSGTNGSTSVDMWIANSGILYVEVVYGGTTYTGWCDGTVCDGNNRFTCGGNVTCYSELEASSIQVTINGDSCNPCDPDPQMVLKVEDVDYAGGDITWCGQTWTQAQVQAGEERTVCPTNYTLAKGNLTASGTTKNLYYAYEYWRYGADLNLKKQYAILPDLVGGWYRASGTIWNNTAYIDPGVDVYVDKLRWRAGGLGSGFSPRPIAPTSTFFQYSYVGKLTIGEPIPYYNSNYRLSANMFGSYVSGGVTYTWSKGAGW